MHLTSLKMNHFYPDFSQIWILYHPILFFGSIIVDWAFISQFNQLSLLVDPGRPGTQSINSPNQHYKVSYVDVADTVDISDY